MIFLGMLIPGNCIDPLIHVLSHDNKIETKWHVRIMIWGKGQYVGDVCVGDVGDVYV